MGNPHVLGQVTHKLRERTHKLARAEQRPERNITREQGLERGLTRAPERGLEL